jgi:uncharacterized protein YecE (DUF72 family)
MSKNSRATIAAADKPAAPSLLVGCAGWSLSANVAASFSTQGSHLERYAQVFSCVEINSSFYRAHQPKTYARWAQSVPDTFRFSVKVPRAITHDSRLRDCEGALVKFIDETAHLGDRLGCILVQLPPSLELDTGDATRFFSALRAHTSVAVACEPRHSSWFTTAGAAVLDAARIVPVQADPAPAAGIDGFFRDLSTLYIRLHGSPRMYYSAYDDAFIENVAARMRRALRHGGTAWCIFDNTASGAAIPNALALTDALTDA